MSISGDSVRVRRVARDKRLDRRFERSFPLKIHLTDGSPAFWGESVDLSTRGLCCRIHRYIEPFSQLKLVLFLPEAPGKAPVEVDAMVVRCEPDSMQQDGGESYRIGVFFLNLDLERARALSSALPLEKVSAPSVEKRSEEDVPDKKGPARICHDQQLARMNKLVNLGELAVIMAHEIKNPLAAIYGTMQVFSGDGALPEDYRQVCRELCAKAQKIDLLLNHLLDYSAAEAPTFRLMNLEKAVNGALSMVGALLRERKISVDFCYGAGRPNVIGDERLLQQAFLNILLYILESSDPVGGRISILTSWDGKFPLCSRKICNCLPVGVPDKEMYICIIGSEEPTLPSKDCDDVPYFRQLDSRQTRLRLSISQRIIEQHSGAVFCSEDEGYGQIFLISLPVN